MKYLTLILCLASAFLSAQNRMDYDTANEADKPLGLDLMNGQKEGVTVFPNGSNDHILISVAGSQRDKKAVRIYDMSGKAVYQTGGRVENTYLVDVSGLRRDLYFIEVSSGNKVYRKKWYRS